MKSGFADFHKLRKYLLGEITDALELESIEKKMLSDGLFLAEIDRVEAELIEEYRNEMLNSGEKKNFEKYFLAAPERKEKFRFMLALEESAAEYAAAKAKAEAAKEFNGQKKYRASFIHGLFASGALKFVSFGILVLCAGAGLWYFAGSDRVSQGLAELRTAYLKQRPTEARLSALDYAPPLNTRGGGTEQAEIDTTALDSAGLLLTAAVKEKPGVDSHRALGLYYASLRNFNKALAQFELGAAFDPAGAAFYADYGAVLLETARTGPNESAEKRVRHLEDSLSRLDKALEIDSGFLPALFNRALCLEEMNPAAAREAWKKYLEKDPSSKWAREAQEHLKALDEKATGAKDPPQVLSDFLRAYESGNEVEAWKIAGESKEMITGTMISEQLTRGLLSAAAQGTPKEADRMLSAFIFLGRLEKENAGDNFFSELADYYRQTAPNDRAKLNRAQTLTMEGYALCGKGAYREALAKFTESRKIFAETRNPLEAAKTDYWISYCKAEGNAEESLKLSRTLADYSRARSYKWLLGQALTQSAATYIRQSKFSPAIRNNKEALKIARETSDAYNIQKASNQLTDTYSQLNEAAGAFENSQNSLRESGTYFNSPRQTWRNYMFASQVSYRFGLGESSLSFAQEAVRLSREVMADPAAITDSFLFLSAVYKAKQDYNDALNAAEEGIRISLTFEDEPTRDRLLADSLLLKAEAQRPLGDCARARETYDQAISLYHEQGQEKTIKNYYARKGRLLCYEELGLNQSVEDDLPAVLALTEDLRAQVEEEDAKTSFFAKEQGIYEFAAAHALKENNTELAFNYIESGKARSLLDDLRHPGASPASGSTNVLTLPEIRQQLPAGSQLVQYAVLPDKLLIWVVTDSKVSYAESNISSRDLDDRVRKFMQYASHYGTDRGRLQELEAELHTLLIKPIQPFLDKEKAVIIAPDKILCYLPFEVLRPAAGKYAIEDYQLSYAPSGTLFVLLSQKAVKRYSGGEESFLGVGNPAFDRTENPNLPDLPAAEKEIRASAAFYKVRPTFLGPDAVKEKILAALPGADVFHFAGHFTVNEPSPQFSKFLLAGNPLSSENDLTTAEIRRLKLGKIRLVVLSACQTAIENYYHGEGAIGIARTFFAADAPVVVASRWKVDSNAAAALMTAFHRNRKEKGLSAAAALRAAQIELLKDENFDSPYFWAAFAAIGGIEKL
jgi:CHAT domain-containing protein